MQLGSQWPDIHESAGSRAYVCCSQKPIWKVKHLRSVFKFQRFHTRLQNTFGKHSATGLLDCALCKMPATWPVMGSVCRQGNVAGRAASCIPSSWLSILRHLQSDLRSPKNCEQALHFAPMTLQGLLDPHGKSRRVIHTRLPAEHARSPDSQS